MVLRPFVSQASQLPTDLRQSIQIELEGLETQRARLIEQKVPAPCSFQVNIVDHVVGSVYCMALSTCLTTRTSSAINVQFFCFGDAQNSCTELMHRTHAQNSCFVLFCAAAAASRRTPIFLQRSSEDSTEEAAEALERQLVELSEQTAIIEASSGI